MKRKLSLVLILIIIANTLTGCAGISQKLNIQGKKKTQAVNLNEKVSHDSKWICSELEGAIDENSELSLKDDFYAACNQKWITENHADDAHPMVFGNNSDEVTNLRLLSIIKGEDDAEATGDAPVPAEYLAHDEKQVRIFSDALMDWDTRNANSFDDLKKYTEYIEAINSMDALKEYLVGDNGQNLLQLGLLDYGIYAPYSDAEHYYVYVWDGASFSLPTTAYRSAGVAGTSVKSMDERGGYVLRKLGYSDSAIEDIFEKCFKFEAELLDHQIDKSYYQEKFWNTKDSTKVLSLEDINSISGNYPIVDILKSYGYENGDVVITDPDYVKYLGKLMSEDNLDSIKAYLLVNTVMSINYLLDKDTYDYMKELDKKDSDIDWDEVAEDVISPIDSYYLGVVQGYLQGPLDTVYVARYCKQEEKEDLLKLTQTYVDKFHEVFNDEDWISDITKERANEKLDAIKLKVLYPDEFMSYDFIDIKEGCGLLDSIADINKDRRGSDASLLEQPVDRSLWDMDQPYLNTTYFNCAYRAQINSINIFAGFFSDSDYYRLDMSDEEKLGKIGVVIGHELTHGFDTTGAQYDENGYKVDWWEKSDATKFSSKNSNIMMYYMSQSLYPGKSYGLNASNVEGEVAADLGGLKCSLLIGKDLDNFDNKVFFEYFANAFKEKLTLEGAKLYASNEHPISWLRVNVDVMQFDEFQEAFDIKKEDGMYLAPEERILVW